MSIKRVWLCTMLMLSMRAFSQNSLPIKEWNADDRHPFVLYISGDGGFNDFSTSLCNALHQQGFAVTALNAKSYFWNKKTPEQTTEDISAVLEKELANRKNKSVALIGYSFGADVMPFVVNRLNSVLKNKLVSVLLVSPSSSTDFEVHWSDMFGTNKKRGMDVVEEINRMGEQKVATVIGIDETHFPVDDISLKNYSNQKLPGGHDFNGNAEALAQTLVKFIN